MKAIVGSRVGAPEPPVDRGTLEATVALLSRRRKVFALVYVGTVLGAVLAAALWTPPYEARAALQVPTAQTGSLEYLQFDSGYTERLLNTYLALGERGRLRDELAGQLGVDLSEVETELELPTNTELLFVRASAPDPEVAASAANVMARLLTQEIRQDLEQRFDAAREVLRGQLDELDERVEALGGESEAADTPDSTRVQALLAQRDELERSYTQALALGAVSTAGVTIVERADVPNQRRGPSPLLIGALAGMAGLASALTAAAAIDRLDPTVFDVAQAVARRGHPLLGKARTTTVRRHSQLDEKSDFDAIEPQAMALANRLRSASPRSLLVTPARGHPSTSLIVADLARALVSSGLEVVLVDAAERSGLPSHLGTPDRPGFYDALRDETPLTEVATPTHYPHLLLVPAGLAVERLGTSVWARKVFEELTDVFDVVLIHAPPLLDRAATSVLGRAVDATVLVLQEAGIVETDLDEALEQVTSSPSAFLGVIVTRWSRRRYLLRRGT